MMTTFAVEAAIAGTTGSATSRTSVARAAMRARRKGRTPVGTAHGAGSEAILTEPHQRAPRLHGPVKTRPDRPARSTHLARRRHHACMAKGTAKRGSTLPARTGADVHLADAFERPGCPLCRERDRAEAAYLEAILAESVNDVPFREALDAGRGFCAPHSRAILDADRRRAGSLGAAILLRATLGPRLRELEALHAAGGWSRARRAGAAPRPPACPVCRRVAEADAAVVEGLVRVTEDARWATAVAEAPV